MKKLMSGLCSERNIVDSTFEQLQRSFDELRDAIFGLYEAMTRHLFTRQLLLAQIGLVEFLLRRDTELTKRGCEWKYSIVGSIWSFDDSRLLVGESAWARLKLYRDQGPFYSIERNSIAIQPK